MNRKLLFVDIGNTRAKWCVSDAVRSEDFDFVYGALPHTESPFSQQGANQLQSLVQVKDSIFHIILCSVASVSIESIWHQWFAQQLPNSPISVFDSSLNFLPIQNLYQAPSDLGNDRWAAIIGGYHFAKEGNYLIVNSGTATTIDYVNRNLEFNGGWILPGINMMLQSLGSKTALLPNLSQHPYDEKNENIFGNSTESAILQGVLHAQLGSIQFALHHHPEIRHLIISGGNGALIHKNLDLNTHTSCSVTLDLHVIFRGLRLWYLQSIK
ncbi:type III pantothenate kinase [Polynucleobacter sp. SHI8]|uniref:type III pantothenate kinase n=1 Tax=unclassified Polynucleobacter TaxID=2640945 RepID=UPI002490D9FE|nr:MULTISPECIES: type III pantothenate kinase [unclassified Polynucleobacter]BDW12181.1 type III pantothenate kinase [Polynucleobacter sp. SHI2]BDW14629.1 type III pantothenate kinase [Polynucleobacter sp. SHI8]